MFIHISVLALCLLVLFLYYRTKKFTSLNGILMFVFGFLALFLRLKYLQNYPILGYLNQNTIIDSFVLMVPAVLVFLFFGYYSGHFKRRIKRLGKLLIPYMFFGGLQQIFFLWVFTDSFYYLTSNLYLTFVVSVMFFMSIHLNWQSSIRKYWFLLFVFAFLGTWIYLLKQNILPQILLHGLMGSVLFTEFTDTDQLKSRLG